MEKPTSIFSNAHHRNRQQHADDHSQQHSDGIDPGANNMGLPNVVSGNPPGHNSGVFSRVDSQGVASADKHGMDLAHADTAAMATAKSPTARIQAGLQPTGTTTTGERPQQWGSGGYERIRSVMRIGWKKHQNKASVFSKFY